MAAQTLDGSLRNYAIWLRAFMVTSRACVRANVCVNQRDGGFLYPVGVDYRPLNGSNNVKELQCHIRQR